MTNTTQVRYGQSNSCIKKRLTHLIDDQYFSSTENKNKTKLVDKKF